MKKWRCVTCGYIHDGAEPPEACPSCGASSSEFEEVGGDGADLIERSRHTNALHCRLVGLGRDIEAICKDGIEDTLDPGCVNVFEKSLDRAYEIMKLAMAEIGRHVGKGKWS